MNKKILLFFVFFTTSVIAEDKCVYKTEQIVQDGKITKIIEHKSCTETEKIGNKSFWSKFVGSPEYENTLIIFISTLMEVL